MFQIQASLEHVLFLLLNFMRERESRNIFHETDFIELHLTFKVLYMYVFILQCIE